MSELPMTEAYPFKHHPCWSERRDALWERIHLPVARICNLKCAFCDRVSVSSCHLPRPGYASQLMKPSAAVSRTMELLSERPDLRIVAVAGPGEPLANSATFATLSRIRSKRPDVRFCLSTNGVLLEEYLVKLVDLGMETVTVSISTVKPETAAVIYEWATIDDGVMTGIEMGREIVKRQLSGISRASQSGIRVKCNTILIPTVNDMEMAKVAEAVSQVGASIQNIVPLVPFAGMSHLRKPSRDEILEARQKASEYCRQFSHCRQCRSDVVGVPGCDAIL